MVHIRDRRPRRSPTLAKSHRDQAWRMRLDHVSGVAAGNHQIITMRTLGTNEALSVQKMTGSITAAVGTINNVRSVVHGQKW